MVSAGTVDQAPPCALSFLPWASHRMSAQFWTRSLTRESGEGRGLGSCMWVLLSHSVVGAVIGLSRFKRRDKDPFFQWDKYQRIWGHGFQPPQCSSDLRFCPHSVVTLKEGALTQDPWIWTLSPSYKLLHARESDLHKFAKRFFLLFKTFDLYCGFAMLRFRK